MSCHDYRHLCLNSNDKNVYRNFDEFKAVLAAMVKTTSLFVQIRDTFQGRVYDLIPIEKDADTTKSLCDQCNHSCKLVIGEVARFHRPGGRITYKTAYVEKNFSEPWDMVEEQITTLAQLLK
jgi:hypothetical protein